ncbi:hypothetical protein GW17_00030410 [Ensete ventricosum]|nr:hypothetical protein GW17_00030410 [Ensete ventricosum]
MEEEEEKKKRGRKNTSPAHRPCPPIVAARGRRSGVACARSPLGGRLRAVVARGRFFSRARRRSVSPCREIDRGDVLGVC